MTVNNILDKIYTDSGYNTRLRVGNKYTNEQDGVYLGHKCLLRYQGIFGSVVQKPRFYSDLISILSKSELKTHHYEVLLIEE